jgi:hypothetical protein
MKVLIFSIALFMVMLRLLDQRAPAVFRPRGERANRQGGRTMVRKQPTAEEPQGGLSRRGFLRGLGIGAGAVATQPAAAIAAAVTAPPAHAQTAPINPARFGRLFPGLPAFASANDPVPNALRAIGGPGGPLDARDAIGRGPVDLIVDPALSVNNRDNPTHTAGVTFMGQFMDHDMTFDADSDLGVPVAPEASPNTRTPGFDLDSVYGRGPTADPQFYQSDRLKFRVESGGLFEDLPRDSSGRAIIADPRNDENLIIGGLHAAFLLFHNRVVDRLRSQGVPSSSLFSEARRMVTWHYQWMILREFLPLFVGQSTVNSVLSGGRRFYRPPVDQAFIPVEFQGAVYRFGHSMVRPSYRANLAGDNGQPFFGLIFSPAANNQADPIDLRGGRRAPRRFIGWQTFFDFGDGQVRPNKRIDTRISTPLFDLPLGAIASGDPPTALPQRNLLRHLTWSLPSGQSIAQAMGVQVLGASSFPELTQYNVGLERSTPLFYYALKEAQLLADGLTLGPMGGRMVAEVIIGLLQLAPGGFLRVNPSWRPTLPSRQAGDFRMVDFLTFARVDPASRGQ